MNILIKLSGESLAGSNADHRGIDDDYVEKICTRIKKVHDMGVGIGIVPGGGNFMRGGRTSKVITREVADYMGMLGTIMNGLALYDAFNRLGAPSYLQSGLSTATPMADDLDSNKAKEAIQEGKIVVFSGGTGHPGCSTDTASAGRAKDIAADVIVKLTNVDGVYDKDPDEYPDAIMYEKVNIDEVINKELGIMDLGAMKMCRDNKVDIVVMNINDADGLIKLVNGEKIGTRVYNDRGEL